LRERRRRRCRRAVGVLRRRVLVVRGRRDRFSTGDCFRLFGGNAWRCGCRGLLNPLECCQRRRAGPRLQSRRFNRIQPGAQHVGLIECLARENKRHDGNQQRKEVKRRVEHQASQRSARA